MFSFHPFYWEEARLDKWFSAGVETTAYFECLVEFEFVSIFSSIFSLWTGRSGVSNAGGLSQKLVILQESVGNAILAGQIDVEDILIGQLM